MKRLFNIDNDGFYGYLREQKNKNLVVIVYIDDDPFSVIGKAAVRWLVSKKISVLALSPGPKNKGLKEVPIDHVEKAVYFLKDNGFLKIAIIGLSSTAMIALSAASLIPEIDLTIAITPCDFVPEGSIQDNLDGAKERPAGVSSLSYHGKPIPFLPYPYRHPKYWNQIIAEGKRRGDKLASFDLFEEAERCHTLQEEEMIKVENIKGHILLVGARDDAMWNTDKYIGRMVSRLEAHPHMCTFETMIFDHGTHFVFPDGVLRNILPVGVNLLLPAFFREAKGFTLECRVTRLKIELRILELFSEML